MAQDREAERGSVLRRLIDRFAPINADDLMLAWILRELPAWVLVATERRAPQRALIVLLYDLDAVPRDQLNGWLALAVVSLDGDVAYVPGFPGEPGELSLDELLGC